MIKCKTCGKELYYKNKTGFCHPCLLKFNSEEKIRKWKETGDTGCSIATTLRGNIREYIYQKQNNCCSICGQNREWNNKELKFVLDHIDGNASNNLEENIRLVCPNCDSQLPTFKSKNKISARTHRKHYE